MKNNQSGVTLIILVVMIIILLILAGITLATLSGNNGSINKSQESSEDTKLAKYEELIDTAARTKIAEYADDVTKVTTDGILDEIKKLDNNSDNIQVLSSTGGKFPAVFKVEGSKRTYFVEVNYITQTITLANGGTMEECVDIKSTSAYSIDNEILKKYGNDVSKVPDDNKYYKTK